jgi:signal transduction histidine kinase
MSLVYTVLNNYDKALYYINQTIRLRTEINDFLGIAVCYRNMGDVYVLLDDFSQAMEYYNKSLQIDIKINARLGIGYTYNHIGILFNKEKMYDEAIHFLDSANIVGKEIKSLYIQNIANRELGFAYAAQRKYGKAYEYSLEHIRINDSIINLEASSRITQLIMQYDFDKQQEEISRLNQIELRKQRNIRNSFIFGFVIAILIIFLVYRSYTISTKSRKQLEIKNKQIEEQKEELIQKNEQLIEIEKVIRQANATKDKFFSIIAHDLKSPFSAIFGFSNLLYSEFESFDEKSKKEYLKNISAVSENAYKLLQNLLEWARSQTGQIEYHPEEINIGLIANDNITLLNSIALKKGLSLENSIDFQTYAFGDKNMVNTVVRNLISNAIKFSFKGGIIKIDSDVKEDYLHITISDTGVGLSEDDKNKLFRIDEKFKREGTEQEKGTGLGLILSKEFIIRNGGNIWAESTLGKGSKFIFTLPIKEPKFNR